MQLNWVHPFHKRIIYPPSIGKSQNKSVGFQNQESLTSLHTTRPESGCPRRMIWSWGSEAGDPRPGTAPACSFSAFVCFPRGKSQLEAKELWNSLSPFLWPPWMQNRVEGVGTKTGHRRKTFGTELTHQWHQIRLHSLYRLSYFQVNDPRKAVLFFTPVKLCIGPAYFICLTRRVKVLYPRAWQSTLAQNILPRKHSPFCLAWVE